MLRIGKDIRFRLAAILLMHWEAFLSQHRKWIRKVFPCFNKFLPQLYQMTWYVHMGAALLDPSATVRYIGRCGKG